MKIKDLQARIVAVYAGRFHPFHLGHALAFKELQAKFGAANTYIATSGKIEPPKSPFSFDEKLKMIVASGADSGSHVVEETTPYSPMELPQQLGLDPDRDILVFGVGGKDMAEDPRFRFTPLKNGTASYFQPYAGNENHLQPFNNAVDNGQRLGHGYIYKLNDYKFKVAGQNAGSASEIRSRFTAGNQQLRMQIISDLYPQASAAEKKQIFNIFVKKLG